MKKPTTGLIVEHIDLTLGTTHLLHDISFTAPCGAVTVFLGPNGAGKTTLLKSVIGLHQTYATGARIMLNDTDLTHAPIHERVSAGLLYVPQHTSLFAQMTVAHNLKLMYQHHAAWRGVPYATFESEMQQLAQTTSLSHTLQQRVALLSGGQKRKVEVVRALLCKPRAILFDEPFAGVDPKSIYELKTIFQKMAERDIAVIISDHHVDQLFSIATHIYVVMKGKIVTSGSVHDILSDHSLKEKYLGSQFHAEVVDRYS